MLVTGRRVFMLHGGGGSGGGVDSTSLAASKRHIYGVVQWEVDFGLVLCLEIDCAPPSNASDVRREASLSMYHFPDLCAEGTGDGGGGGGGEASGGKQNSRFFGVVRDGHAGLANWRTRDEKETSEKLLLLRLLLLLLLLLLPSFIGTALLGCIVLLYGQSNDQKAASFFLLGVHRGCLARLCM